MTQSAIYRHKDLGFTVQILYWGRRDIFDLGKNWCRYKVLDGEGKGMFYEAAIGWFLHHHNPIGG